MAFLSNLFDRTITFISFIVFGVLFKTLLRTAITLLVVAFAVYFLFFAGEAVTDEQTAETKLPTVVVESAANTSGDSTFTAVGTLQAVSEAKLQTESGGRIIGVYTELGANVRAGSIIARLEGSSESAQLLQAQGAYEAAIAGSAQGDVGKNEAENAKRAAQNAAVTTYKNAYTSVSGVVFTSLDKFFANPNSQVPGVRISKANTSFQNMERVNLQTTLPAWQSKANSLTTTSNLNGALTEAEITTKKVLAMVDDFIIGFNNEDANIQYTAADYIRFTSEFNALRGQLVGILSSIDAARTGLANADEAIKRASIAGSGSQVSSADAQIKIALGSLRAAQANYEKTLVRSPINGVVNALYLKTGEYAAPSAPAAIIANNNQGLEVSTSVSQEESALIKIGDQVRIDKVANGTIAAIGGSIDPTTGKVAVKISVDENNTLQNGSTVSVVFTTATSSDTSEVSIPLSAVKMTGSGPIVFTVDADTNTLISNPVVLGNIRGDVVVVTEGINRDTPIVTDGRGLKEGAEVTIETK
ncbi:MAG: efflux RND transporter periplasmic adaptor subunit [Patescibacteria group bacterium]